MLAYVGKEHRRYLSLRASKPYGICKKLVNGKIAMHSKIQWPSNRPAGDAAALSLAVSQFFARRISLRRKMQLKIRSGDRYDVFASVLQMSFDIKRVDAFPGSLISMEQNECQSSAASRSQLPGSTGAFVN